MPKLKLCAKAAASLGLFIYLWFKIDPLDALSRIRHTDAAVLAAGTLVLGLQPVIGALRWQVIVRFLGVPQHVSESLRWTYVSVFFGQVLPATIGADAVRVWLARRGSGIAGAFNSVLLDRLLMLLTLALLIALGAPALARLAGSRHLALLAPPLWVGGALVAAMLINGDRLPTRWQRRPAGQIAAELARACRRLAVSPKFAGAALVLSLASYAGIILAVDLFAVAFGAPADLVGFLVLVPPVLAVSTLPISIGGWGTRELAMVAALGLAGISADIAVLSSVWLGIASVVVALPGSVLHLTDREPLRAPAGARLVDANG